MRGPGAELNFPLESYDNDPVLNSLRGKSKEEVILTIRRIQVDEVRHPCPLHPIWLTKQKLVLVVALHLHACRVDPGCARRAQARQAHPLPDPPPLPGRR